MSGLLDRLRARYRWLDHAMLAWQRFNDGHGNFYAAGITYFTVFALFPLLMVGFAIAGFVLSRQPHLLADIQERIKHTVSGDFGHQLVKLIDHAIKSRTSVGVIGLATASWAGLGWIANLREALTQMWGEQVSTGNYIRTKLSDFAALLSAFVAIVITIGLTALGDPALMTTVLGWFGVHHVPGLGTLLRSTSVLVAVAVSWLLFTWMIARLPRKSLGFASAVRAGLLAAVGFEILKQAASVFLRHVVHGPAGAAFGPILGFLVFAYYTAQLVLFATAWAATSAENLADMALPPPQPALVVVRRRDGVGIGEALAAMALGALAALGVSWARRR
ncbi:MAG: inner membrane protein YhjD [Mycobacteriaceae bacterium]|nr:inner membrane protein YhjD [Mycobacteriaceae bacterium]MBV9639161.1 inner membrane protein YhjD [Mycobacteriaceae bacterium]